MLRSKKKVRTTSPPVLSKPTVFTVDLQEVVSNAGSSVPKQQPTVPQQKPATPSEVTITSSSGEIESNLSTSVSAIIPQLEKSGETLETLLSELQTEWKVITTAYDQTKNSLATSVSEYDTIVSETFDKKDFTFNQNKTCGVFDLGKNGVAYIKELAVSTNPVEDCMRNVQCLGYTQDKIYGHAETCAIKDDGSDPNGIVHIKPSSYNIFQSLDAYNKELPKTVAVRQEHDSQVADLEKIELLLKYQTEGKATDVITSKAVDDLLKGYTEIQKNFASRRDDANSKFSGYTDTLAARMARNIQDKAAYEAKLKRDSDMNTLAVEKTAEFKATEKSIATDLKNLRVNIENFMATNKIVNERAIYISEKDVSPAIGDLNEIASTWTTFQSLYDQHETNMTALSNKIKALQDKVDDASVDIGTVKKKIWSIDGDVSKPAEYITAQVYRNKSSETANAGVCDLRLGTATAPPEQCSVELVGDSGKTIVLNEGKHQGVKFKKDSKIVVKKGGKVVDDFATDCMVVFEKDGNEFYAGNTDFKKLNEYMPLHTDYSKTADVFWEDSTDEIRVFSSSRNNVHAMKLPEKLQTKLNTCTDDCEAIAKQYCLEAGSSCVGIFKKGIVPNEKFGLLSQASGDAYSSIQNPSLSRCVQNGDDANADDSGSIQALMKSHFGDYMKFSSYIKRQDVLQARSESMFGAITARNTRWADATQTTENARSAKLALVATSEEKLKIANQSLSSRRMTLEKSINTFEKAVAAKKAGFVAKSTERSNFEQKFQEQTGDIKNLIKHPAWKLFQ